MKNADFKDWKQHPVTQVVFSQLTQRILDVQEILSEQAGINPIQDREYVGAIKAYKDMVNIEFDEQEVPHD